MPFQVGDRVRLKSGGQAMVVEAVNGDNISCVWHEKVRGRTESGRDTYLAATLEPAPKPGIGVVMVGRS
jgi:uncharacterized protein YodC (DUF2158 family)